MTHTAETWPIACAMLALGNEDSQGGPIQDASTEEWAKHLRQVKNLGFTEIDPPTHGCASPTSRPLASRSLRRCWPTPA